MAIDANIIAWGGLVANLIVSSFLIGAVYGRLTSKISANTKDIADVKLTTAKDIAEVRASVDAVGRKISTPEGDPVLLSYKAHDKICGRITDLLSAELRHVGQALDKHSAAVSSCGEQVSALTLAVAVLEEKVQK